MSKFLRKILFSGALFGAGYLIFSKKGQKIQQEMKEKLPSLMAEVKERYSSGRKTMDAVIDEVIEEWRGAKKLMDETSAPLKREIKRRMK